MPDTQQAQDEQNLSCISHKLHTGLLGRFQVNFKCNAHNKMKKEIFADPLMQQSLT